MATKTELMGNLNDKLNENNTAIVNDEQLPHSDEELKADAKALTLQSIKEKFGEWRNAPIPLKTAIDELLVPNYSIKVEQDKDTGLKTYSLREGKRVFDLGAFAKYCTGMRITHSIGYVGKLGIAQTLFAARVAKELGADYKEVLEKHRIPQTLKREDVTQQKNPISNSTIEEALQDLVDAIYWVGDDETNGLKMRTKDVKFIVMRNTKRGKDFAAINTGNSKALCETVLIILHCMMNGKDYQVEYDKIADNK